MRAAQPGDTPAEYDDAKDAWRDVIDLQGQFSDSLVTLFDMSTGKRHFRKDDLSGAESDATEAMNASEIWTDDWIIQRAGRIRMQLVASFLMKPNLSGRRAGTGFVVGGGRSVKVQISGRGK